MMRLATLISLLSTALIFGTTAFAAPGQLEINATCALQSGCFPGDSPGYPVTISQSGSYRLTSSLLQSQFFGGPIPSTMVEIQADAVDLDLGGFTIGCSLLLGGSCSGSAAGIAEDSVESEHQMIRIANGHIQGLPGRGIDLSGTDGAVVENIRVRETGLDGIATGAFARVADCTVLMAGGNGITTTRGSEIARNAVYRSSADGIHTDNSTVVGNRVILSGTDGIYAESSTILDNNVQSNLGDGIDGRFYSTIARNTVDGNGSIGISATVGTNVSGNTVTTNGSHGISFATGGAYRDNLVTGNGGATVVGGTNAGGNVCGASTSCP